MKKLTCHCGGVEAEVNVPEKGFEKVMRCNCSMCKRKGYIIGVIGPDDFKLVKGEELLVYRVGTYLQDHSNNESGLHVLKGSHRKPHSECASVYIPSEIGDVVIWDCRVFHKAGGKGNQRCFVHSAFGKPNFLLDLYIEATQARVTKQNQKSEYVMIDKLKKVLDKMGVMY